MWNRLKALDPLLYLVPAVLGIVSVIVIFTLTNDTAGIATALRQGIFFVIGIVLMLLATFYDYRSLRAVAPWMYGFGMFLLALVPIIGKSEYGATLWIDIGPFQLQPSEIFKVILIVTLAAWLSRTSATLSTRRFAVSCAIVLIPVAAVLAQPDLGTAMILSISGVGMLLHARTVRWQRIVVLAGVAAAILTILLSFKGVPPFGGLLQDYQKKRIATFLNPSADEGATGYQVRQSKIAVGSGAFVGQGLGKGSQSQLNFLPVAHSDFIFAGIAEAWGLVGSYAIIGLFGALALRFLNAARIAKDEFGSLLCVGILVKLLFEIMVNIGMNIGIMPVTGIPLPFLSYGGTTMLANFILIGVAQSVVIRYKRLTFER